MSYAAPTSKVVYTDCDDSRENKIHNTTCPYYRNRKRDARTTAWSRPYASKRDAIQETAVDREAECCD